MKLNALLSKPWMLLHFSDMGFREKGFIGHYNFVKANVALMPHVHDCIEICYLAKGTQIYEINGQAYQMKANDLFLTRPLQEHSSGGNPQDKAILYWIQIAIPQKSELFFGLSEEHVDPLFMQLLSISKHHFRGSSRCKRILDELFLAYFNTPEATRRIAVGLKIVEYLLEVTRCAAATFPEKPSLDIADVIEYIENHPDEQIYISELATKAGLSISRLKTKFKQEIGIPPAEYILRCKIEQAKQLLSQNQMSITQIAFALNFSSSQYFATVFKRFAQMTPTEYLKQSNIH